MEQTSHFNATLARILHFDFSTGDIASRANIILLQEYLRRANLWGEATGCQRKWMFGDYAECIDPAVRAPIEAVEQVKKYIRVEGYEGPVQKSCVNALHWAALKDVMDVEAAYGLPDLYEPLLVLYDRGEYFLIRHGFFEVGTRGFWVRYAENLKNDKPFLSLDRESLDAIDKGIDANDNKLENHH